MRQILYHVKSLSKFISEWSILERIRHTHNIGHYWLLLRSFSGRVSHINLYQTPLNKRRRWGWNQRRDDKNRNKSPRLSNVTCKDAKKEFTVLKSFWTLQFQVFCVLQKSKSNGCFWYNLLQYMQVYWGYDACDVFPIATLVQLTINWSRLMLGWCIYLN